MFIIVESAAVEEGQRKLNLGCNVMTIDYRKSTREMLTERCQENKETMDAN